MSCETMDTRCEMYFDSLVLTISDYNNYGNRLQNFALVKLLEQYGTVTTIYSCIDNLPAERGPFHDLKMFMKFWYSKVFSNERALEYKKNYKFWNMTRNMIPDCFFCYSMKYGLMSNQNCMFGKLVIGSDQVWNYKWLTNHGVSLRLGSFAINEHPVISYAASFGVSEVDDVVRPIFQNYLPRFRAISVRENRGAELVKELTGLDAAVVLDPTLMLPRDCWMKITENFVSDNDMYVLTYFLGRPSEKQEQDIQAYAKAHGYRVRRILDKRDKETYVAGPQDFVELFSKARYVFTDSYHACCFSILFHKQFTVFNRAGTEGNANMNSRMETLFRLLELDSVVMDEGMAPQIDYAKVDRLLSLHRAESQAWLDQAMEA